MWWSKDPFLQEILHFSIFCRGATLLMQVVFNTLIPDHLADAFSPPQSTPWGYGNCIVDFLLGGLGQWDSKHFLFIAEHGYQFEHNMAFFPLFPLSLALIAQGPLWPLAWILSMHSRLLLSATLLNSACFVLAAIALYHLGCIVLQSRRTAYLAALLFCMNPASIFMTSSYSESLFAMVTFAGLWQLERYRILNGCVLLSFATATRANGMVNAGFLLHRAAHAIMQGAGGWRLVSKMLLAIFVIILPFALFQYYSYRQFCLMSLTEKEVPTVLLQLAMDKGYRLPGPPVPAWCSAHLPLAYSHIQSQYWNVGLLRYFQLHQLPNFFLAVPVIFLSIWALWDYSQANKQLCVTLGLWRVQAMPSFGYHGSRVFVYVAHLTTLLVFGFLCMHVQVLTRLLFSSSPVLYWFCSHQLQQIEPWLWEPERSFPISNPALRLLRAWTSLQPLTRYLLVYFLGYWVLGTAMHVNFLPWT
ncbi:GPI mannosyltransferase 2 [Rhinophrynus dorsalis]